MSNAPFNKLTPGELERLAMLAEEAGEIVQAAGALNISAGADGMGGQKELQDLETECADFMAIANLIAPDLEGTRGAPGAAPTIGATLHEKVRRLAIEAGLIVQVCCKVLRHGYASHHPHRPDLSNREELARVLDSFMVLLEDLRAAAFPNTAGSPHGILARKLRYTHHQVRP